MSNISSPVPSKSVKVAIWVGRLLSLLVGGALVMSAVMKFKGDPKVTEGMAHLGLPESMIFPLGVLELTCTLLYLIPQTSVLGAVLLAGYMGGAICVHWRVGDPFVSQAAIGVVAWLGIFLRERRLWPLIPWRRM